MTRLALFLIILIPSVSFADWNSEGTINSITSQGFSTNKTMAASDDGRRVIIGNPAKNSNRGQVQIYEIQSDNTWNKILELDGFQSSAQAGYSVDMSGDGTTFVYSSYGWSVSGNIVGEITIGSYSQAQQQWLYTTIAGGDSGQPYGDAVAISNNGEHVVFSQRYGNSNRGKVYKFTFDQVNQTYVFDGNIISGTASNNYLGRDLLINDLGDVVVVSDIHNNVVEFHKLSGGSFSKFYSLGGLANTNYGDKLNGTPDLSTLIISAPTQGGGKVYLHSFDSSNNNVAPIQTISPSITPSSLFGRSVSLSNDASVIVISGLRLNAGHDEMFSPNTNGYFMIYRLDNSSYTSEQTEITSTQNNFLGRYLTISGDGNTVFAQDDSATYVLKRPQLTQPAPVQGSSSPLGQW